jgi:hypothetical protein
MSRAVFQINRELLLLEIYNPSQEPSNQQWDLTTKWFSLKGRFSMKMRITLGLTPLSQD